LRESDRDVSTAVVERQMVESERIEVMVAWSAFEFYALTGGIHVQERTGRAARRIEANMSVDISFGWYGRRVDVVVEQTMFDASSGLISFIETCRVGG
jgi:hypothetical protein